MKAIYAIAIFALFSSCDGYNKLIKKGTSAEKLAAATKYFEEERYIRAQPLLEELKSIYVGRSEREDIYYMLAASHYGLQEYMLAGYYFGNFVATYTLSPKREKAAYLAATCQHHKSMSSELDQTTTKAAINTLQAFINQYPNSQYVQDANTLMDELRQRILKKAYDNAKLYYQLGHYKSAVVACNNALDDYPDMINREELAYLIVASNYFYAKNSISSKQEERYSATQEAATEFFGEYGKKGKYGNEVQRLTEKAAKELKDALALIKEEDNKK